ncbi:MAG TPA: hypothetical protein VF815_03105 [Myxococcaceae bacterium]
MASLRRGLVDKVKKAAESVGKKGVQVATKAGTRGARAIVETTAAAVKTVDKIQSKLGRTPRKASTTAEPVNAIPKPVQKVAEKVETKVKRASSARASEAAPVAVRESGRKAMPTPAVAAKRSKAPAPKKEFKAKRGQKHLHTGR